MARAHLHLTPEIQQRLCREIARGVPVCHAVKIIGVTEPTFYNWIREGKKPNAEKVYADFRAAVEVARGKFVATHIKHITYHAKKTSWQASAWLLERLQPDTFGKKETEAFAQILKELAELRAERRTRGKK